MSITSENSASGGAYSHLKQLTIDVSEGAGTFSVPYGENEIITWSFEEYVFFRLSNELDKFYKELSEFISLFNIEPELFDALLKYQKDIIKQPFKGDCEINSSFDFYGYFNRIYANTYSPLEKKNISLEIQGETFNNRDEYARICIWYGRRDDAQLYTGKKNSIRMKQ